MTCRTKKRVSTTPRLSGRYKLSKFSATLRLVSGSLLVLAGE